MRKNHLKLISFVLIFTFVFSMFGDIASACQQNYFNLKQQQEFLKTTISQTQDGQDRKAVLYDLEGLKLYNSAYENLKSVSNVVYQDYSKLLTKECDKAFVLSLTQEGIAFAPECKVPRLDELLTNFESEISNQYVLTYWNTSNKLFEIKRDLSLYAVGLINSGKCDDKTVSLLSNALKNFFMADKILCNTSISDLSNIVSNVQDKKISKKASVMLKTAQKLYLNANRCVSKGQAVPSSVMYNITYTKLLEALNLCGFQYNKDMMQDTKDSDSDGISDMLELIFGTNPFKPDSDGDGLSDSVELIISEKCSPTKYDTDGNKISDSKEDIDNDGLKNYEEVNFSTDLIKEDSDEDGLNDGFEVNTSKTDPLKPDTDDDGLSDGDEYKLGLNPLVADSDGNGIPDGQEQFKQTIKEEFKTSIPNENNIVNNVTINFEATGNAQSTTVVESVYGKSISDNVVGRISYPFDIKTEAKFSEATVSFNYDESVLNGVNPEDLGVLWFDVDNKKYVEMDSAVDTTNKTVSFKTTHFSEYLLINKKAWFDAWRQEIDYGRKNDDSGKTQYYDIVLAIDSSGSMDWNDPGDLRKTAAKQFVDAFLQGDQGSVVDFDDSAIIKIHLSKNKDDIKAAIDTIDSYGGTDIDIAVNTGIDELLSSNAITDNSKIIVLLTDGQGSYSSTTTKRAQNNNVKVFTVGLSSSVDETLLGNIANDTGGKYYQIASSEDLLDAFKRVQDDTIGNTDTTDTDGDGLYDVMEITGFRAMTGEIITTDPYKADTDGDGLSDKEEIGQLTFATFASTQIPFSSRPYYNMSSYPNKKDSDNDGYNDDIDSNPFVYNALDEDGFYDNIADQPQLKPIITTLQSVLEVAICLKNREFDFTNKEFQKFVEGLVKGMINGFVGTLKSEVTDIVDLVKLAFKASQTIQNTKLAAKVFAQLYITSSEFRGYVNDSVKEMANAAVVLWNNRKVVFKAVKEKVIEMTDSVAKAARENLIKTFEAVSGLQRDEIGFIGFSVGYSTGNVTGFVAETVLIALITSGVGLAAKAGKLGKISKFVDLVIDASKVLDPSELLNLLNPKKAKKILLEGFENAADSFKTVLNKLRKERDALFEVVEETKDLGSNIGYKLRNGTEIQIPKSKLTAEEIVCSLDGCFTGDTLVLTREGNRRIDEIKEGDFVYAKDVKTGQSEYKKVKYVYLKNTSKLIHLVVDGEEIRTTSTHLFFTDSGWWKAAKNIQVGERILTSNGELVTVTAASVEMLEEPERIYNLNVEDYHTYFVGTNGLLVHNDCTERMTEFINKVWKAADDDFRNMLKAANGHAYDDHIGKTLDEIREIADYQGKLCSTFTDEATALKAIRESLEENAEKVTNWLDNEAQGELELIGNHGYDLGFGVRPSSITKIKPLNSSRMYLVKDTTQVSGFRIKTVFPEQ